MRYFNAVAIRIGFLSLIYKVQSKSSIHQQGQQACPTQHSTPEIRADDGGGWYDSTSYGCAYEGYGVSYLELDSDKGNGNGDRRKNTSTVAS